MHPLLNNNTIFFWKKKILTQLNGIVCFRLCIINYILLTREIVIKEFLHTNVGYNFISLFLILSVIQRVNQGIRLLTIWSQHSSSAQEKQLTPTLQARLWAMVALSCPQIARNPFCQSHLGSLAWRGVRRGVWSCLTLSPSLPHPLCLALQPIPLPRSPTHFQSCVMEMVVPITAMILAQHSTNTSLSLSL